MGRCLWGRWVVVVGGRAVEVLVSASVQRFSYPQRDTFLPSPPVILIIDAISCPYAECGPPTSPQRGRRAGLVLGGGRRALLHPVGGLTADRSAGGGDGDDAAGTRSPRSTAHRGRPHPGGAHRGDPRAPGGRGGGARRARGPARGAAADGLVPYRGRDADAGRDRGLPRLLPGG